MAFAFRTARDLTTIVPYDDDSGAM